MTIFISYSHADEDAVHKLAARLVQENASVWIDKWELNVGDSIIQKVEEAITDSSALLVVLSKASVTSEWCKKEITSGLLRELEEKRVVVLPVLLEDCDIPLFLRDKMYADLRTNYAAGISAIMSAVAKVSNPNQSRFSDEDGHTDWAVDWETFDDLFHLRFTIINTSNYLRMTFLTEITIVCDEALTARQRLYQDAGLDWAGRMVVAEGLFDVGEAEDIRVLLEDSLPKQISRGLQDSKTEATYHIHISCRRLGEDNGKDQLINISDYLKNIREYLRATGRRPTTDELAKLRQIAATPLGTYT